MSDAGSLDKREWAKLTKERKENAFKTFDQRTQELVDQIAKKGRPKLRIRPFERASQEELDGLKAVIERRLATAVTPKEFGLYNILPHLKSYNLNDPPIDEAGFDTPGFELAISELNEVVNLLQHGEEEKGIEYLLYRYNVKKFANKRDMGEFIPVLHLEAATDCNLVCTMCYQSDPRLAAMIKEYRDRRLPLRMSWELFTKVVDEAVARGCRAVVFAGRGEPTLNARFTDMLRYCHKKGVLHLKFNTNATMHAEKWEQFSRELLSMNAFLTIVFSVDAGDAKVFEEIRVGAKFEKVKANVETFGRIRRTEFPNSPV